MNIMVMEHPRIPSKKHFNDIANTPLWSCLLAGYAAASIQSCGYRVTLLDANQKGYDFNRTAQEVVRYNPKLLCIHAVYFWEHTSLLFEFLEKIRKMGFSGHLNLFGFFPTMAYSALLEHVPSVDSIAVGECEHTLAGLAVRLELGVSWQEIPGLAVRNGRGSAAFLAHKRKPEKNPDVFPPPVRNQSLEQTVGILASRGCYNHCRFCPVPAFYNNGPMWRGRDPEEVAKEIQLLKEKGASDFYFYDPNFIGPGRKGKERTRRLCDLLKPLKITFGMETRANDLDPEILCDLKAAGLTSLLIGIESGSSKVLGKLDKHGSIAASQKAIEMCRTAGLEPEVGFLMFVPDSTLEDLYENLDFLKQNNLLDRLDRTANLLSHRQIIFMGTSGYQLFKSQGRIVGTGPLGFQADVSWADAKVEWMAEMISYACLYVLRETGNRQSPLFFEKNTHWRNFKAVNDYLVDFFEDCLKTAVQSDTLPEENQIKPRIENNLAALISEHH